MIIYQNGSFIRDIDARVSPFDHGFLYGMGLFETLRVYDGHPFLLDDHLSRLREGLKDMYIETNISKEDMMGILQQLLMKNDLRNARVRINISAGEGIVGLPSEPYMKPNVLIFINGLSTAEEELTEKNAVILQTKRNTPETSRRLKSHHYGNNIAAKMELRDSPGVEGIFLTSDGYVSEAITSNIFWVKDSILYTPNLSTGILPGITRQFIMVLAERVGLSVNEGLFFVEDFMDADEVFLTNSIQEIVAIKEIYNVQQYQGKAGYFTNSLFEEYKKYRTLL